MASCARWRRKGTNCPTAADRVAVSLSSSSRRLSQPTSAWKWSRVRRPAGLVAEPPQGSGPGPPGQHGHHVVGVLGRFHDRRLAEEVRHLGVLGLGRGERLAERGGRGQGREGRPGGGVVEQHLVERLGHRLRPLHGEGQREQGGRLPHPRRCAGRPPAGAPARGRTAAGPGGGAGRRRAGPPPGRRTGRARSRWGARRSGRRRLDAARARASGEAAGGPASSPSRRSAEERAGALHGGPQGVGVARRPGRPGRVPGGRAATASSTSCLRSHS